MSAVAQCLQKAVGLARKEWQVRRSNWINLTELGSEWSSFLSGHKVGTIVLVLIGRMEIGKVALEFPTGPFTTYELQDQEIAEFYVIEKRRATDFEAPKL